MNYKEDTLREVIRRVFIFYRQKKNLTQENLAIIAKTTRQFISQVESGKRAPSITSLGNFANAVGISLTELFQEVDRWYNVGSEKPDVSANKVAEPQSGAQTYSRNARKPNGKERP